MPRNARKKSMSGIYHVMVRGNEKRDIFNDDCDREKLISILDYVNKNGICIIYSYCLMSNHVHLLVREGSEDLQTTMKRIEIRYVWYFNRKYNRVGHLFQDRYRSETVEGDQYLLSVARYIHNNPVKAGIVSMPGDYEWSSFKAYISGNPYCNFPVDIEFLSSMFSSNRNIAAKMFMEFTCRSNEDVFIDIDNNIDMNKIDNTKRLKNQLKEILRKYGYGLDNLKECKDRILRNRILSDITRDTNISLRDLSCMTGISKDIISRAKKCDKKEPSPIVARNRP